MYRYIYWITWYTGIWPKPSSSHTHTHMHTRTHTNTHTHTHARTHTLTHTHTHIHTHTRMHTHTHIILHTHTHTQHSLETIFEAAKGYYHSFLTQPAPLPNDLDWQRGSKGSWLCTTAQSLATISCCQAALGGKSWTQLHTRSTCTRRAAVSPGPTSIYKLIRLLQCVPRPYKHWQVLYTYTTCV